jgi:hypothetical protein
MGHIIKITMEYKRGSRQIAELMAQGLSQEYLCPVAIQEGGE